MAIGVFVDKYCPAFESDFVVGITCDVVGTVRIAHAVNEAIDGDVLKLDPGQRDRVFGPPFLEGGIGIVVGACKTKLGV